MHDWHTTGTAPFDQEYGGFNVGEPWVLLTRAVDYPGHISSMLNRG